MVRSVRASLKYYSEQFGSYPHSHVRLVERPGRVIGPHSEATTIDLKRASPSWIQGAILGRSISCSR